MSARLKLSNPRHCLQYWRSSADADILLLFSVYWTEQCSQIVTCTQCICEFTQYLLASEVSSTTRYNVLMAQGVMELWGFSVESVWLPPNFQRPLVAKLCVSSPKVLEAQERARGPLSPCQVWWGSDFTRRQGCQKRWVFVCLSVCLSVCRLVTLLRVYQSLRARFLHEGVVVQKRFWCSWIGEGL